LPAQQTAPHRKAQLPPRHTAACDIQRNKGRGLGCGLLLSTNTLCALPATSQSPVEYLVLSTQQHHDTSCSCPTCAVKRLMVVHSVRAHCW
jgi:hypothetical protein